MKKKVFLSFLEPYLLMNATGKSLVASKNYGFLPGKGISSEATLPYYLLRQRIKPETRT